MKLVLASTSAYRRELLQRFGLPFDVARPDINESPLPDETPWATAERLAVEKARAVAGQFEDALIIGSDQVAYMDSARFGKPGRGVSLRRSGTSAALAITASLAVICPASAQEEPVALAVRDLTPFSLPFLGFAPAPPPPLGTRGWSLEARFSVANTFVHSPAVERYLGERGRRAALSPAELVSLAALPTEDFYFDGEIEALTLESRWAVGVRHEVFVSVPVLLFSGGALDSVIEGFHDAFGLGQAGRDQVARSQFQLLLEVGGKSLLFADAPTHGGLSDPIVGGRWRFGATPGWNGSIEAAIKAPVAGERLFLSSGGWF